MLVLGVHLTIATLRRANVVLLHLQIEIEQSASLRQFSVEGILQERSLLMIFRVRESCAYMRTPEANLGHPPRETALIQLREARAESRRHPGAQHLIVRVICCEIRTIWSTIRPLNAIGASRKRVAK